MENNPLDDESMSDTGLLNRWELWPNFQNKLKESKKITEKVKEQNLESERQMKWKNTENNFK